jgi:hypothetical protein
MIVNSMKTGKVLVTPAAVSADPTGLATAGTGLDSGPINPLEAEMAACFMLDY